MRRIVSGPYFRPFDDTLIFARVSALRLAPFEFWFPINALDRFSRASIDISRPVFALLILARTSCGIVRPVWAADSFALVSAFLGTPTLRAIISFRAAPAFSLALCASDIFAFVPADRGTPTRDRAAASIASLDFSTLLILRFVSSDSGMPVLDADTASLARFLSYPYSLSLDRLPLRLSRAIKVAATINPGFSGYIFASN